MKQLLKKYLIIYFAAVICVLLAITIAFVVGDLVNRMKPGNQILFEVRDEKVNQANHILKLYAWSCSWNDDQAEQSIAKVEMELGEPIRVGTLHSVMDFGEYLRYDNILNHPANDIMFKESSVFIAEGDGEIEAEYSGGWLPYGKPGTGFSDAVLEEFPDMIPRSRYSLLLNPYPKRRIGNDYIAKSNRDISVEVNEKMRNSEYKQRLSDAYDIRGEDGTSYYRCVEERLLFISMYDLNNAERLIAKAEIRIYMYSAWQIDKKSDEGSYLSSVIGPDTLDTLGINIPDSYGYTEAVLYDYWQTEEW
ncbi:MAG: hypothetical protein HFE63_05280 [Clostridiales bacterium]|nr:hypothetical protein [Clostridiales bacterium]